MSDYYEKISDYIFVKDIGEGNFGKVKFAVRKKTGEEFAIKIMNKEKIRQQIGKTIIPEIEISKKFNHKNVIHVYSILEDINNYYIIMEYCSKGELFDYIVSRKKLSKEESSIFFYQLINGIEYIHSQGYSHRDLKPENLLLTNNNILKIIDFGLSHEFNDNMLLKTKCGSPSYAAPEVLKGNRYDGFKSDIWCCGIILHAMLCGTLPFEGENNKILFRNIIKCELKLDHFDDEIIKNLIKKILNPDPKLRIKLSDIKQNEFYLKGEILFNKMEKNNKYNKKKFKIKRNNKFFEKPNSKKHKNIYKLFDEISTDRIKKLNFNLLNGTNDNFDSKKNNDKKSLDIRILQTSHKAEEIILRHSNKKKLKLQFNPNLRIIQKPRNPKNNTIFKYNLNDKIKKLLKKNNSEEDRIEKKENLKNKIFSNIKMKKNLIVETNNYNTEFKSIKEKRVIEGNDIKKENFTSFSIKSKISDNDNRYKSLNNKNILYTIKDKFNNRLIFDEHFNSKSQEKNLKNKTDIKSFNLYRMIVKNDKLKKAFGLNNKKYLFTENPKLHRKKVIDLHNKEMMNEFLPIIKKSN